MSETSRAQRMYRQGSFVRVFAGQLILLAALFVTAAWLYPWSGIVFLAPLLVFAALATLSAFGPAHAMAQEVTVDQDGMTARKYFGRSWSSRWDDLICADVLDVPSFGSRRRLKIESRTNGVLFVSDLIDDFDGLVERLTAFASAVQPCGRPGLIERWLMRG